MRFFTSRCGRSRLLHAGTADIGNTPALEPDQLFLAGFDTARAAKRGQFAEITDAELVRLGAAYQSALGS
jgi:hypothetical protein